MIDNKFDFEKAFQDILYRIDNLINEESRWIVESTDSQYFDITNFRSLSAILTNCKKVLINIKNNNQKGFLWCHIRHINLVQIHPQRIRQKDKQMINILIIKELNFLCQRKILVKLKQKTKLVSNVVKTNKVFGGYAMTYKVELIHRRSFITIKSK